MPEVRKPACAGALRLDSRQCRDQNAPDARPSLTIGDLQGHQDHGDVPGSHPEGHRTARRSPCALIDPCSRRLLACLCRQMRYLDAVLAFLVATAVAALLTPLAGRLAWRVKATAHPSDRGMAGPGDPAAQGPRDSRRCADRCPPSGCRATIALLARRGEGARIWNGVVTTPGSILVGAALNTR